MADLESPARPVPGARAGRLSHALDGVGHLPRREVVDHVPGPFDDLQHAAWNAVP